MNVLPGLGPKSAEWLARAGIHTVDQLRDAGAVVAFLRVQHSGSRPSLNLLCTLHGALCDKPWTAVTDAEKRRLRSELEETRSE